MIYTIRTLGVTMTIYNNMHKFTVEEMQSDFDNIFEQIEIGQKSFIIVDDQNREFFITPYNEEMNALLGVHKDIDHG